MKITKVTDSMTLAWKIAKMGAANFGGKPSDYFKTGIPLRIAHSMIKKVLDAQKKASAIAVSPAVSPTVSPAVSPTVSPIKPVSPTFTAHRNIPIRI